MTKFLSVERLQVFVFVCVAVIGCLAIAAPEKSTAPEKTGEAAPPEKPRVIIGRIEYVMLREVGIKLKGRIDTGAGVSSLNAKILEIKKTPDGESVRFEIKDNDGGTKTVEEKIVDWAQIKVLGSDRVNRRPIIEMSICLGGKKLKGRVNLSDRSNFLYPMLIGRNLLNTGKFLVDPGAKYLVEPGCD